VGVPNLSTARSQRAGIMGKGKCCSGSGERVPQFRRLEATGGPLGLSVSPTKVLLGYSDSLYSSIVALSFQWVPVMLDFLEMNWQTRSPKPEQHSPLPTFPDYCKD